MNAAEIIDEIRHLSPTEQAQVVSFVRELDAGRVWTPEELGSAASRLAEETDPVRVEKLKGQIVSGFYGGSNA
jgi:hypothetical protein